MGGIIGKDAAATSGDTSLETGNYKSAYERMVKLGQLDPSCIIGRIEQWSNDTKIDLGELGSVKLRAEAVLEILVDTFYVKVLLDEKLEPFFRNSNMEALKKHQVEFFLHALSSGAFEYTKAPIRQGHAKLFLQGLDENHFDLVAGHLVESMKALNVPEDILNDVVTVVLPLRAIFEEEARHARESAAAKGEEKPAD
mmetsp:Transcript_8531/g.14155  ORF Transcript_8531/g.14155 Transcript_8531/m.14155 type:complete len:197 (+) Transcript_8531:90-680(+)